MFVFKVIATAELWTTKQESEKHMAERSMELENENEITEQGKEAAGRLAQALDTAKSRVQEGTVAGAKATDRAIREHPYESLGIAFGLGVLIGVLIARR